MPDGRVDVVIGTQPSGQGHETSFAQVVAGSARRAGRGASTSSRRYRRGAGRRRLAFRPLDAPRRDGDSPRRAIDLIDKGKRIAGASSGLDAGRCHFDDGRFAFARYQSHLRFSRTGQRGGAARPAGRRSRQALRSSPTTRCTIRCFPTAPPSARSRSIPTPARSTITRYACDRRRRPLHQSADRPRPDPRRDRAGRRPGDVGTGLSRSRQRAAADRLVHGLRHAARRTCCRRSAPRSPRCCRRPIRSASRPAARAARRPAPAVMVSAILDALGEFGVRDVTMPATPYKVWQAIRDAQGRTV